MKPNIRKLKSFALIYAPARFGAMEGWVERTRRDKKSGPLAGAAGVCYSFLTLTS